MYYICVDKEDDKKDEELLEDVDDPMRVVDGFSDHEETHFSDHSFAGSHSRSGSFSGSLSVTLSSLSGSHTSLSKAILESLFIVVILEYQYTIS